MKNKIFSVGIVFVFILLTLPGALQPQMAKGVEVANNQDYTRSCTGVYMVTNQNRNMVTIFVERFTATASGGIYIPNTIRMRAYRKALACMQAAWERPYETSIPTECTPSSGINGYETRGLLNAIREAARRDWHWDGNVEVDVFAYIYGDKGCGGERNKTSTHVRLADNYSINTSIY